MFREVTNTQISEHRTELNIPARNVIVSSHNWNADWRAQTEMTKKLGMSSEENNILLHWELNAP